MNLAFLGQSYESTVNPVDVVETSATATFLSNQYTRKQFNVALLHPPEALTYRGVPYNR